MNQTERLYKIEQMLSESQAVQVETMLERLEISRATFKRDLDYLRDRLNAPIVRDRGLGGYRFDGTTGCRIAMIGSWRWMCCGMGWRLRFSRRPTCERRS